MTSKRIWENALAVVALIVLIAMLFFVLFSVTAPRNYDDFERRDAFVQECIASERYTREDCLIMSGGWKP